MALVDQCLTSARAIRSSLALLFTTQTEARDTRGDLASAISLNEDMHEQHLQNCSESHFMSILPFDFSKSSVMSFTHNCKGIHGNPPK